MVYVPNVNYTSIQPIETNSELICPITYSMAHNKTSQMVRLRKKYPKKNGKLFGNLLTNKKKLDHRQAGSLPMVTDRARSNSIFVLLGQCSHSDSRWNFGTNIWWQNNFANFNRFIGNFLGHYTNSSLLWLLNSKFSVILRICVKIIIFCIYFFRWCDWFDTYANGNWICARSFDSERCFNHNCLDSSWRTCKMLCDRLYGHACEQKKKENYFEIKEKQATWEFSIFRSAVFFLRTLLD